MYSWIRWYSMHLQFPNRQNYRNKKNADLINVLTFREQQMINALVKSIIRIVSQMVKHVSVKEHVHHIKTKSHVLQEVQITQNVSSLPPQQQLIH